MSKFNKSYRIRTEVGKDSELFVKLDQDYDILEIMSLKINQVNAYKLHSSNYGVIAGRVLANNAFGVPNAKISVFIPIDNEDSNDVVKSVLYPYNRTSTKNKDNIRYNLLPDRKNFDCHTVIGTFPDKQYVLDNDSILEIFEKYYKFTTRTNNAGDYMLFGIPTGVQNIHVDIDLSDIGILSQRPRDMVYKGYDINQFENPNKFKHDTNLASLTQVISQDKTTDVIPFWSTEENTTIGITRCDIDIEYKFEPTCVFLGSVVSDTASNGFSQKCIPTPSMGAMDEITTGSGTIEMIRKTPSGNVEEFQIQGTQLINGDGVWCYQIPMNLDYMMTDEFGNMVPTNDPNKGIPTRAKVRFRMSMQDFDNNNTNVFRGKVLVPHNPKDESEVDYQFGTQTKEHSYRDLFWNCVYSVKSYIPRIQKGSNWKSGKFTGFKRVNYYADNNPIPYNNIRIRLPFMYVIMCTLVKFFFRLVGWVNRFVRYYIIFTNNKRDGSVYTVLDGTICDDNLENVCFIPGVDLSGDGGTNSEQGKKTTSGLIGRTIVSFIDDIGGRVDSSVKKDNMPNSNDPQSINDSNRTTISGPYATKSGKNLKYTGISITNDIDYLIQCVELNLAQEYKVIQFDFYNDWINGLIYIPRWFRKIRKKMTFIFPSLSIPRKVSACNENYKVSGKKRNIVQQCSLSYNNNFQVTNYVGCKSNKLKCHKAKEVRNTYPIFTTGGIINSILTSKLQTVYYFKPIEKSNNKIVKLFSVDIILLGTLNECDKWGIPNNLKEMVSSTYQLPSNLALTDSDIEGGQYDATTNKTGYLTKYSGGNLFGKNSSTGDMLNKLNWGGTYQKIFKGAEDGNYTELSGIDWGYTGPLQNAKSATSLYKPGGHFLGLSCTNSESTIKSCVNLSRICEYGVSMSQRYTVPVPNNNKLSEYGVVPSGFISKDEISDTTFRQTFATLNHNNLKTKIDKTTGFPIYDFNYVNPTNFSGELKEKIFADTNYNRKISDKVVEKYTEFSDDDNRIVKSSNSDTVNEVQIMRTGEETDNEYLKFRFGIDTLKNDSISDVIQNKTLIKNGSNYSFPIYENSFYFYFGLHDGKTAIDEFKKQYYSVCENNNDLTQQPTILKIKSPLVTSNGVNIDPNGKISFTVEYNKTLIEFKDIKTTLYRKDSSGNSTIVTNAKFETDKTEEKFIYSGLSHGKYEVVINVEGKEYSDEYSFEVKQINLITDITGVDFNSEINTDTIMYYGNKSNITYSELETQGGYIEIYGIASFLNNEGLIENIDIFSEKFVDKITITIIETGHIIHIRNKNNSDTYECSYSNNKIEITYDTVYNKLLIPVPYCEKRYSVVLSTKISSITNELSISGTSYSWDPVEVKVNNGTNLNISYNNISYNNFIKPYVDEKKYDANGVEIKWWENEEFWNMFQNNSDVGVLTTGIPATWFLKDNLFMTKVSNQTHTVYIEPLGGKKPYYNNLYCLNTNGDIELITGATDSYVFDKPTHNYNDEDKKYTSIWYEVEDSVQKRVPENKNNKFIIPIIYKPFFYELCFIYSIERNKFHLYGQVYNGKTWTITEGFNEINVNDFKLIHTIKPTSEDYICDTSSFFNGKDKFKNRSSIFSCDISEIYGVSPENERQDFVLDIGTKHIENDDVFVDNLITTSNNSFYRFTMKNFKDTNNKTKIQINNLNTSSEIFSIYLIKNGETKVEDENGNTGTTNTFMYPIDNSGAFNKHYLNIIYKDLMEEKIKNTTELNYSGFINENNVIDIEKLSHNSGETNPNVLKYNDKVYFLIVNTKEVKDENNNTLIKYKNTITRSDNDNLSTMLSVTLSNLIDLNTLSKFYPLEVTIGGINVADANGVYQTLLFIASKGEYVIDNSTDGTPLSISATTKPNFYIGDTIIVKNIHNLNDQKRYKWQTYKNDESDDDEKYLNNFKNKKFKLSISPINGGIVQTLNTNSSNTAYVVSDITQFQNTLGINKSVENGDFEMSLKCEYDIYNGDVKSPETYTKEIKIIHIR